MTRDLTPFFERYVDAYNRSLGDAVDAEGIRAHFAECFVGAGPTGVMCGQNDESFTDTLTTGYAFYKSIGTEWLSLRGVEVVEIDDALDLAKVGYRATYRKTDQSTLDLDFAVSYLLQTIDGKATIFGFVAGDETALYREHGLLPPEPES